MEKVIFSKREQGFTLLEVLISVTILGIISLAMLSFFSQSYSYTKKSEESTLGIYTAKNMLNYLERQDFTLISELYAAEKDADFSLTLHAGLHCEAKAKTGERIFSEQCSTMFQPLLNNRSYSITAKILQPVQKQHLLPVMVTSEWNGQSVTLEGYIVHEKIR
ncbi:prepilin-type N-terminal cleavage/methylation domain-containing protein [Bacillus lacus]|uniref:Prepilin-type N-terminal cleavage/methylation domain-containing protein n=1 Tax=Metabacillus lacus TaxID=1983721 RepID=A0A7X2IXF2_9BACI|nr:prepilin-type N-terminal cleavage/methylation domain-containing protein [Metabacillus lacus]MRX71441.1 prepilin-type N-terminal cleavage/methylation domain-containing protein [Metabacillus lacus]